MERRMGFVWILMKTIFAVLFAALLWLYLFEEMGMGAWECWPS